MSQGGAEISFKIGGSFPGLLNVMPKMASVVCVPGACGPALRSRSGHKAKATQSEGTPKTDLTMGKDDAIDMGERQGHRARRILKTGEPGR